MKKKVLLLLIIGVLLLTGTVRYHRAFASSNSIIRVKITVGGTSIGIVVDGEYTIKEDPALSIPRGSYTVSVSGTSNVRLQGAGIDKVIGKTLTFVRGQYTGSGNNHLTIKGTTHGNINYLGDFVFTVNSGELRAVNHIPLEQYLYGVVAYEMSNSFPLEALKVQAVCARSYAVAAMSSSGSYDIGDTASHQVYKGYNPSYQNVILAVDSTAGEVLSYNNKVVPTYYSASNGGQTELPGNMFGGGSAKNKEYPYLVQKDDPYDLENPSSRYQKIFVPREPQPLSGECVKVVNVSTNVNIRSGPGTSYSIVGKATNNTVFKWLGETGDWNKIEFEGKEAYISKSYSEKITSDANYSYVNSVLNDIQNRVYNLLKAETASATDIKIITVDKLENGQERWPGTGSRNYVTANVTATVDYIKTGSSELTGKPKQVDVVLELMKKSGSSYSMSHDYLDASLRMRGVEQADSEGGYYVTNGRYGHGIGMSQRGAQTMASKYKMSYREILAFYFEGTQIIGGTDAPTLTSSAYHIGSNMITGLSANLSVEKFLSNLSVTNGTVRLTSAGSRKTSGIVATGDTLELVNIAGAVYKEYPLVIYGDVNGDGEINLVDIFDVHRHILRMSTLKGPYSTAANVNDDGDINLVDIFDIHRHILRIEDIKQ